MILRAPADGAVSVIVAEVGENVHAGQPILMVEAAGQQWLSFNIREDHLSGLTIGKTASVMRNGADRAIKARVTELRPLGTFATWQAERVIGDHDRNTLRLRFDPEERPAGLEPGMTVWIRVCRERCASAPSCACMSDTLADRCCRSRCCRSATGGEIPLWGRWPGARDS
jgi:HlyD family secretion protein